MKQLYVAHKYLPQVGGGIEPTTAQDGSSTLVFTHRQHVSPLKKLGLLLAEDVIVGSDEVDVTARRPQPTSHYALVNAHEAFHWHSVQVLL